MKKMLFYTIMPVILLFGMLYGNDSSAQTHIVNIGTRTGSQYELPFNSFYHHSYNEMIYLQQEIGSAGYIGAIAFDKEGAQSLQFDSITIWMATIDVDNIATTSSWIDASTLHQVFHQEGFTIPEGERTIMIPLDSTFYYDGEHHLAICIGKNSSAYSNSIRFACHNTTDERCIYRQSDNDRSYSQHPGTNYGYSVFKRPNIKLLMNSEDEFCLEIANIHVTEITENSISIEWPMSGASSNYEVAILDTAISNNWDEASPMPVFEPNYMFEDLQANTTYKIGVRKECTSGTYSPWHTVEVNTRPMPNYLPYFCDFETEETRSYWLLDNGSNENRWVIGDAAATDDGTMGSLYVSNNNAHRYNNSGRGVVYAKSLIRFETTGEFNIGYDWIGYGESSYDYMRAMLVPKARIDELTASDDFPNQINATSLPYGYMAVDGGSKLNLSSTWQHYAGVITISDTGDYYLVYAWRNDASSGNNPPAGIDNVVIEESMCSGAENVFVSDITTTSVMINASNNSGNNFEFCYRPYGAKVYDTLLINTPYVLYDLPTGTYFEGVIRSNCGIDGNSYETTEFTFQTNCEEIVLPWAFGAEGSFMKHNGSNEEFPYCWESFNGNNGTYCWRSNTRDKAHSGHTGLNFCGHYNANEIHDDWLFMPKITYTGNEVISMWIKGESDTPWDNHRSRFALYASTDELTSIDDKAHYQIIPLSGEGIVNNHIDFIGKQWRQITIELPADLIGDRHLALVVSGVASNSFYIDDIYIHAKSDLEIPYNLRLTDVSSTSATVTWSSNAHSFVVYYGAPGFSMDTAASINVQAPSVEIMDLNPSTMYEYRVVAMFDGGVASIPSYPAIFTTACHPIRLESLPLVEDFEDNAVGYDFPLDLCWAKGTNSTSLDYPYVTADQGDESRNSLEFHGNMYEYSYVALPAFEADITDLVLSCSIYLVDYSDVTGALEVGLMRNPHDAGTFTAFDTLRPSVAGAWNDFKIPLTNFDATKGLYLTLMMPIADYNKAYLDNIKVELQGECDMPTQLKVVNNNATSATITWSDQTNANDWTVYYGKPGFEIDTVSHPIQTNSTTATITELTPQTEYEFCVVTTCPFGGYSTESIRVRFTTTCAAISELPYREGFENYGTGNEATIDPCWTKDYVGISTTNFPYPAEAAAVTGQRGLYLSSHDESGNKYCSYTALPTFEEELTQLKVKFDLKSRIGLRNDCQYYSKIVLGIMGNPDDISTFDTLQIIDLTHLPSGTIQSQDIPLNTYTGTGKYIAFLSPNVSKGTKTYGENIIYLDNVEINTLPQCQRPTNLHAHVESTTIGLSWEGTATEYEITYSTHPTMEESNIVRCSGHQTELTGLEDYTYYYINIRSVCSSTEYSEWMIYPIQIRTEMDCGDGYRNERDTIGNGTQVSYEYVINGGSSFHNGCNWMIFDADELSDMGLIGASNIIHSIALQTGKVGSAMPLKIYMKETSKDGFTGNGNDTIPLSEMTLVYDGIYKFKNDSWNEITLDQPYTYVNTQNLMIAFEREEELEFTSRFYYSNVNEYKTAYCYKNAQGRHSQAKKVRGNMIFNICSDTNTCIRPYHTNISNLNAHTVTIDWNGQSGNYQIVYGYTNFNPHHITTQQQITTTSNQIILRELEEQTTYYMYLRSVCGTDYSEWSELISFTTPCEAIALPYQENFDDYAEGETINSCWHLGSNYPMGIYPYLQTLSAASAPNSLKFGATTKNYSYVALPMFSEPIENTMVRFKLQKESDNPSEMQVGIMTDPTDINSFHYIASATPMESEQWENFEISFSGYHGTGSYITFLLPARRASSILLDDIEVMEIPYCSVPENIVVKTETITTHSAIIAWEGANEKYEIVYGDVGFSGNEGIHLMSNQNSILLEELNEGSEYEVRVRSLCSASNYSEWSKRIRFSTEDSCYAPEIVAVIVGDKTATLSWSGDAMSYQLMIKAEEETAWGDTLYCTETEYTFEDLIPETTYAVQLRSACESDWVDTTFTTQTSQGIEDGAKTFEFEIYPNPTADVTTLRLKGIEGKINIRIVDINGKLIVEEMMECGIDCEKRMDVKTLPQGIYFVHIIGEKVNLVRKIIVK